MVRGRLRMTACALKLQIEKLNRPQTLLNTPFGFLPSRAATSRNAARSAVTSSQAIVQAATLVKLREYRRKVANAWDTAYPNIHLPGSHPDNPMPAGGLEQVTGFKFIPAIFDSFGGCSTETEALIMTYAKRVAARQGRKPKGVYNRVYGRLSYCIWSLNAQAVILRRPRAIWPPH